MCFSSIRIIFFSLNGLYGFTINFLDVYVKTRSYWNDLGQVSRSSSSSWHGRLLDVFNLRRVAVSDNKHLEDTYPFFPFGYRPCFNEAPAQCLQWQFCIHRQFISISDCPAFLHTAIVFISFWRSAGSYLRQTPIFRVDCRGQRLRRVTPRE